MFERYWIWRLRVQDGVHIDIAEGTGGTTDWGAVLGVLGALVLVLVVVVAAYFAVRFFRGQASRSRTTPVKTFSKASRQRIERAFEDGNYEAAGDLLSRNEEWAEAAEAYAQAGAVLKAARAFQHSGNLAQAAHYFKQGGEGEHAAKIYADQGKHMAAAAEFYRASSLKQSARQYELAEDFKRAAETFEEAGVLARAGELFERVESPLDAARCFSEYFEDQLSRAGGDLTEADEAREFGRRAANLYKDAGKLQEAGTMFQRAGFFEDAANCLRTTGELTQAAELLMRAQQPLKAARVLEEAGEEKQASRMRAEAALKSGQPLEAADLFDASGDSMRALEIYEEHGSWARAASIYEDMGEHEKAFEYYRKAGKPAHAARCAEVIQRYDDAASLYREADDIDGEVRCLSAQGDYFRAGRIQFEHRRYAEAFELLSKIDSRDPIYPRSLELQGDVLNAQGRFEKAYGKYRSALGNSEISSATLPLAYKMGRMLEEESDRTGALEYYNAILSIDKDFEDVSMRVKSLLGRGRRSTLPGATGSGIFSAPEGEDAMRRYEIVDEIARGGMGIVCRARDTVLGRIVAFKILGENLRDNDTAVKYFLREARAAAALSHPNIVTIFDAGEQDGEYYMAMEFVEGTTLKELIKRKGALPEDQVRYILIHCSRALQYAHGKGIIHRDIKSGNVMITRDKALKIMDFGLAKFMREYQKEHTQQVGTPFYMSPEQIIGKSIDFRADLYSLGCTIFECATGTVPFFKGDLSYHHVHTLPPAPRSINPALSRPLEKVILKLLEKKPDDRYQSAEDILKAVAQLG